MFKQGLYQFIPSVKMTPVVVLWVLAVVLLSIGILLTAPGV